MPSPRFRPVRYTVVVAPAANWESRIVVGRIRYGNGIPGFEKTCPEQPVMASVHAVPSDWDQIQIETVYRKESLGLGWRLEPSHLPLPLSGRLVGDFLSIVRVPLGVMSHRMRDRPERRDVAAQLVRDKQAQREMPQTLQSL